MINKEMLELVAQESKGILDYNKCSIISEFLFKEMAASINENEEFVLFEVGVIKGYKRKNRRISNQRLYKFAPRIFASDEFSRNLKKFKKS